MITTLVVRLAPIQMRDPAVVAWDEMVARTPGFSLRSLSRRYPHPEERMVYRRYPPSEAALEIMARMEKRQVRRID